VFSNAGHIHLVPELLLSGIVCPCIHTSVVQHHQYVWRDVDIIRCLQFLFSVDKLNATSSINFYMTQNVSDGK